MNSLPQPSQTVLPLQSILDQLRPKRVGQWRVAYESNRIYVAYSPQHSFSLEFQSTNEIHIRRLKSLLDLAVKQSPLRPGGLWLAQSARSIQPILLEILGPIAATPRWYTPNSRYRSGLSWITARIPRKTSFMILLRLLPRRIQWGLGLLLLILAILFGEKLIIGKETVTAARQAVNDVSPTSKPNDALNRSSITRLVQAVSQELWSAGITEIQAIEFSVQSDQSAKLMVYLESTDGVARLGDRQDQRQGDMQRAAQVLSKISNGAVEMFPGVVGTVLMSPGRVDRIPAGGRPQFDKEALSTTAKRNGLLVDISEGGGGLKIKMTNQPTSGVVGFLLDPNVQHDWSYLRMTRGNQSGLSTLQAELQLERR